MGRSVSYPQAAEVIAYDHVDWEEDDPFAYEDLVEDARYRIACLFPSMTPDEGWLGSENRILASNGHAFFGLSEYCGLLAYWLVPRENTDTPQLHRTWCNQVAPRFEDHFATLARVGMMSNGEGVYRRRPPAAA
jgi:hypothetical protein